MNSLNKTLSLGVVIAWNLLTLGMAFAESNDQELNQLLDLGISDLVGMEVSTASKKNERLDEAPGVISVITRKEIQRFGARNLRDVLDRVTNTQVIGSNLFLFNSVSIRAGSTTHVNNHSLLLLNGRPIRDSHSGGVNLDIYANFPLSAVERIEIIRGPGSVLYGSNAYTGVVNIITSTLDEEGFHSQAKIHYGSFHHRRGEAQAALRDGDLSVLLAAQTSNIEGGEITLTDEVGIRDRTDLGNSGTHFVLNSEYKGLSLNAIIGNFFQDNVNNPFNWPSDQHHLKRQYIDVGYTHDITESWDASLNVSYNGHDGETRVFQPERSGGGRTHGRQYELTSRAQLTDKVNLVAGAVYDILDGNLRSTGKDYDHSRYSLYSQADYLALESLKLIAGVQWNKSEGISDDFSPRVGAIINFSETTGLKLLYGQAFLTAYGAQSFSDSRGLKGNPDLAPEEIETYDAQLFYHDDSTHAGITFYYSRMSDTHRRTNLPSGQATTVNEGRINFHGVEAEGKTHLTDGIYLIGNASWQENEDEADFRDVTYSPNWMVKTGISYEDSEGFSLGVFNSYFGSPSAVDDFHSDVALVNTTPKSYHLLTGNISFNLDEYCDALELAGLTISLFVDNILDEDIYFPSFNRTKINSLPHHSGRGYYGTVSVEF